MYKQGSVASKAVKAVQNISDLYGMGLNVFTKNKQGTTRINRHLVKKLFDKGVLNKGIFKPNGTIKSYEQIVADRSKNIPYIPILEKRKGAYRFTNETQKLIDNILPIDQPITINVDDVLKVTDDGALHVRPSTRSTIEAIAEFPGNYVNKATVAHELGHLGAYLDRPSWFKYLYNDSNLADEGTQRASKIYNEYLATRKAIRSFKYDPGMRKPVIRDLRAALNTYKAYGLLDFVEHKPPVQRTYVNKLLELIKTGELSYITNKK